MGIQERKEREKEQRREDILNAAEKVFWEKGLAPATMDEIAEKAGLGKSTLYLYYKSKEDLYLAVTMRGGDIMVQMFEQATSTGEPTVKLIWNLGEAYYEYFRQYRNYFRMYYFLENAQLHSQVSPEMQELCLHHDEKTWKIVIDLIRRGIQEGVLRADLDPVQAAVMLWSNANGLMRQIDRADGYWKEQMHINLEDTLRTSNSLLVRGMMSETGLRDYGTFPGPR
jgi:TetR/AcrR family transcriptional regulator